MSSSISWIDFADENRNTMMDVVKLFREKDTIDELGVGTVRDAFSNYFFPGTSTIQTRAKYMLFVPWIYEKIEAKRISHPKSAEKARRYEIKLIKVLLKSEDTEGVIGSSAGEELQRLPSEIYWAGLYDWGIRRFPGSRSEYHRSLTNKFYRKKELYKEEGISFQENWHPGLPEAPKNFLNKASIKLSFEQAEYLKERITDTQKGSLLYCLLDYDYKEDENIFWLLDLIDDLSNKLQENVKHAQNFAELIQGAYLLYNYLLAEKRGNNDLISRYFEEIEDWKTRILARWSELKYWHDNIDQFWNSEPVISHGVAHTVKAFINSWFEIVFDSRSLENLQESDKARRLLENRERRKKGKQARLHNKRALERWSGRSGTSLFDFRWQQVKTIVSDITEGLAGEER